MTFTNVQPGAILCRNICSYGAVALTPTLWAAKSSHTQPMSAVLNRLHSFLKAFVLEEVA